MRYIMVTTVRLDRGGPVHRYTVWNNTRFAAAAEAAAAVAALALVAAVAAAATTDRSTFCVWPVRPNRA